MGKKFMGYDNASELITAIGTKIKAKYTKPNAGIPKSDLATAVQTSLDKADTAVQNSSLVAIVNDGAKNVLNFDALGSSAATTSDSTVYAAGGVEFTLNTGDNTITMKRTRTSTSPVYCALFLNGGLVDCADLCDDNHYLSGCPSGGSNTTFELMLGTVNYRDYGNGVLLSTPSSSITSGIYVLLIARPAFSGTVTFKPMISTKPQFEISNKHEPFALGNQYLTPALVKEIDSGAKNKFDINGVYNADATLTISGNTITMTTDDTRTYLKMWCKIYNSSGTEIAYPIQPTDITANGVYNFPFAKTSNASYMRFGHNGATKDGKLSYKIDGLANGYYILQIKVINCTTTSGHLSWGDIMICAKAAFDVSNIFVPYRPNYDLVCNTLASVTKITQTVDVSYTLISNLTYTSTPNTIARIAAIEMNSGKVPTGIIISRSNNASMFDNASNLIAKSEASYACRQLQADTIVTDGSATTYYIWAKVSEAYSTMIKLVTQIIGYTS